MDNFTGLKQCGACGELFPLEAFSPRKGATDGRIGRCRDCMNAYSRRRTEQRRLSGAPPRDQGLRTRYAILVYRAKLGVIPFDLAFEEYAALAGKPCHYCGSPIASIGVDRLDNELGYTADNIVPACPSCNVWKNTMSLDQFRAHITRLYQCVVLGQPTDTEYVSPHLQRQWVKIGAQRRGVVRRAQRFP